MTTLKEEISIIRQHQDAAPVHVVPIANDLGVNVYRVPGWPDSISGRIIAAPSPKGGHAGYAIEVNASHPTVRRRFTIAHEIAHFILHRPMIGDALYDDAMYRSGLSNAQEREANRVAADILMPWHLLNRENRLTMTPKELAEKYMVSETAMRIRLGLPT